MIQVDLKFDEATALTARYEEICNTSTNKVAPVLGVIYIARIHLPPTIPEEVTVTLIMDYER